MRRLLHGLVATLGYGLVTVVVTAAALLALARLLLPAVDAYRAEVEAWASQQLGQPVQIGALNAELLGIHPAVVLEDVALLDARGRRELAHFDEARIELNPLASWRQGMLVTGGLELVGADLTVERTAEGAFRLRGVEAPAPPAAAPTVGGIGAWFLGQRDLSVRDSRLVLLDGPRRRVFREVDVRLRNDGDHHRLNGSVALPPGLGGTLRVAVDATGDPARPQAWQGRGYVAVDALHPSRWADWPAYRGVRLTEGAVDLELWGRLQDSRPVAVEGAVTLRDAHLLGGDGAALALERASTRLRWQTREGGWRLDLDRLRLDDGPATRLAVERGPEGGRLLADRLQLAQVDRIAALGDWLAPEPRQALAGLRPGGEVTGLRLDWSAGGFAAQGRVQDLALTAWRQYPGVRGLDARFRLDRSGADVHLEGGATDLWLPELFRQPLSFTRLQGTLTARRTEEGWALAARELDLATPDLTARAGMRLRLPAEGSPFLDLRATFEEGRAAAIPRYLPGRVMDEEGLAWLDRAFLAGRITRGRLLFHGRFADFPFRQHQGRFEVRFGAEGVDLNFHRDWPDLAGVDADLLVDGPSITVRAGDGRIYSSRLGGTVVRIPNLVDPVVRVDGQARGPAADLLRLVDESPLRSEIGRFTEKLRAEGGSRLELDLVLPVDDDARAKGITRQVAGRIGLAETTLFVGDNGVEVSGLAGSLGFDDDGLSGDGITGEMLGRPVALEVATAEAERRTVTRVTAQGGAVPQRAAAALKLPLLRRLAGDLSWRGTLEFPHDPDGRGTLLRLQSNLAEVGVDLPAPVGKAAGVERTLGLSLFLSGNREGELRFSYGELLAGAVELAEAGLTRAELAFGESATLPAERELRFTGRLEALDLGAWTRLWAETRPDGDERPGPPIVVNMERLHLAALEGEAAGGSEGLRRLAGLDVNVARFGYGEMEFGRLRVRAESTPGGMRLRTLDLEGPAMRATGSGRWNFGLGRSHTTLEFELTSENMGRMMRELGFISVIREGELRVRGELTWPGTPADVALKRLNGKMDVQIKDGVIEEVKPGAPGRLLGLLSVRALPRRLTLDFRDLFEKGMRFQKIHGDLELEQGSGYTDNLQVESRTAVAVITGRTDLVNRRLDQEITVIPNVSGSLPLAGGLALGPQVGAALWLLQKVIKPGLEKVIRYQYAVTGSWEDPNIDLVAGGPEASE